MTKKQQIAEVAKEYESSLQARLIQEGLLGMGEKIVYSIRIEPASVVTAAPIQIAPKEIETLTPKEVYDALLELRKRRIYSPSKKQIAEELGVPPSLFRHLLKTKHEFHAAYVNGSERRPLESHVMRIC